MLSQKDVAEALGTNTKQVIRWWRAGYLPGVRLSQKTYRFTQEAVDAFMQDRSNSVQVDVAGVVPRLAIVR